MLVLQSVSICNSYNNHPTIDNWPKHSLHLTLTRADSVAHMESPARDSTFLGYGYRDNIHSEYSLHLRRTETE